MTKTIIPNWVTFFGSFLAIFGLALGIMGYFKPDMVIPGFTSDSNAHDMAIWMTSALNIAMGVPSFTIYIVYIALFIIPEILAIRKMTALQKSNVV